MALDRVMPGLSGDETPHRLRQLNAAVKLIISSGYSDNDALSRLAAASVAGFLKKPFTARQIAQAVRQALDQGPCFSSGPGGAMG